ncbi:peptidylprolyl isomerase [Candidatus Micrarchaeota archaeon]|nr:peptidylprolyl isomerase [Candidatus Micrarchaeota archaeon]
MDKLKDGDFMKVSYTGRTATGKVFDTTSAEKAKEAGLPEEGRKYAPVLVVIGKGHVVKGLEESLKNMSIGEQKSIELSPENAFGVRDPNLVRILPLAEFKKRDLDPFPGMMLDLDGVKGIVKSVSGGRVMVDLNHILAGEKITYDVKVEEKLTETNPKIQAVLDSFSLTAESFKLEGGVLQVVFSPEVKKDVDFIVNKSNFVNSLLDLMGDIKKLSIVEEYTLEQKEHKA